MQYLLIIAIMMFGFTAASQSATPEEDNLAVENAIRDYIEGWYKGDMARIDRSLHDDLVKRIPQKDNSGPHVSLRMVPKSVMVDLTGKGGGEDPDAEYQIFVDHIEKDIATGRVLSPEYLDYLQLAKTHDGWQIVNILFRKH